MSGSIPLSCSLRDFAAVLTALTISPIMTYVHASLRQTSQRRFSYVPLLLMMWYTLHARAATAPLLPVDYWCKVFPIFLFLNLIFLVLLSPPQEVCLVIHA